MQSLPSFSAKQPLLNPQAPPAYGAPPPGYGGPPPPPGYVAPQPGYAAVPPPIPAGARQVLACLLSFIIISYLTLVMDTLVFMYVT